MSYSTTQYAISFELDLTQEETQAKVSALISELSDALAGAYEDWSNTKTADAERELLLPLADKFSTGVAVLSSVLDTNPAEIASDENDPSVLTDAFQEVVTLHGNKVSLTADSEKGTQDCFCDLLADALLPVMEDAYQVRTGICIDSKRGVSSGTEVVLKNGDTYSLDDLVGLLPR